MGIEERISFFKQVRDIPYYIATQGETDYCCSSKAVMLQELLKTIGIKSRLRIGLFKWESLELPGRIMALPKENPQVHTFLEVFVPETKKWVKVDSAWDGKIKHSKIKASEWDGLNDTETAMPLI
ncbi:MAG: hypothetical protein V1911_00300, partial [Candidatus Micrarchaeota archaeon]